MVYLPPLKVQHQVLAIKDMIYRSFVYQNHRI